MKHFNKWLLALVVLLISAGAYAQCGSATVLMENDAATATLPGATDSAWYTFTVPSDGYITISSCDRNAPEKDTRLFLYNGSCGALNALGTSDNDCGLAAMLNDVPVQVGQTYFLVWDNKTGGALSFDFTISFVDGGVYNMNRPENDNICSATAIDLGVTTSGNNENASVEGSSEYNLTNGANWLDDKNVHNTVWYQFVAPATGVVSVGAIANFDVQISLFGGNCSNISGLNYLGGADYTGMNHNEASFNSYCVEPGTTYYVMVDGFGAASGDFDVVVNSIDIGKPFMAISDSTLNLVNGVLCPGATNWNLSGKLVLQSDMSDVVYADYVNSLHYVWTDALNMIVGTTASVSNVVAGTYVITITDTCGNIFTDSITLTDPEVSPFNFILGETTNPTCVDAYNGTVVLTHEGGTDFADGSKDDTQGILLTMKHSVDPEASEGDLAGILPSGVSDMTIFSQLEKGTYRVYAEDACGNVDSVTFVLVNPVVQQIELSLAEATNPFCPTTATGAINVDATGGEGEGIDFSWYVFDGMDYILTTNNDTDYTDIVAGMYRLIGVDPCDAGNTDTLDVTLEDPTIDALEFTAVKTNPTTFDAKNGSIEITVTGGKPSYNATWWVDGTIWDNYTDMLSLTNLPQGIYRVYITDTCDAAGYIDTTFVVLAPVANDTACSAILLTVNDSLTTYHNQGATANGETGMVMPLNQDEGYTGWSDVNFNQSVWFKFVAPESGAVNVSVNHYQGLVSNLNFDPQVAIYNASSCEGEKALVAANDNALSGPGVNDSYLEAYCLTPGATYYLLVDGYQGIGQQGIFSIDLNEIELDEMMVNTDVSQPNCLEEKGSVYFDNVTGGVYRETPESYLYRYTFVGPNHNDGGSIKVDFDGDIEEVAGVSASYIEFNNLDAGTYYLTVMDTCGHASIDTIEISPNTLTPFNLDVTLTQPDCPGDNNGTIEFLLTGGGTPGSYNYELYKNAPFGLYIDGGSANSVTPEEIDVPGAGIYYLEVYDLCDNANTKEYVIELTDRDLTDFGSIVSSLIDPTCPGAEGYAKVMLTGGRMIANYDLRIGADYASGMSVGDGSFEDSIEFNLTAGSYFIRVEDHCMLGVDTLNFTITDPTADALAIESAATNPSVYAGTDGTYTYTLTGGFTDYTASLFVLDAPMGVVTDTIFLDEDRTDSTEYTAQNLAAGYYRLDVTDRCDYYDLTDYFTVLNPPMNDHVCDATVLTIGESVISNNIAATVQAGEALVTPPLDEDCDSMEGWCSNDGIDGSVWYKFTVPASGSFSVSVTSGDFDPQVAVYTTDNCESFGAFTRLAANDNKPSTMTGESYVEVGCLTPGTTIYVLVDSRDGVAGEFEITAAEINTVAFSATGISTDASTEISKDGMIAVSPVGGVQPYSYAWSNGLDSANTMSGLDTGLYSVIVTDKCGASETLYFTIDYTALSNDDVCNARWLSVDGEKNDFFNFKATVQAGEETITPVISQQTGACFADTVWCTDGITASVWFKFVAPQSGSVRVDLCSVADNAFDPQLAVYHGELCVDFTTFSILGANDDSPTCAFGSGLNLTGLTPCETYYILVDADEDARGTSVISLIDLGSILNAGRDTTVTRCNTHGDINLAGLVGLGADQDGVFSDDDATGELSGAVFSAGDVEPGTYHFTYSVADSCDGVESNADRAVITVIVSNCTGINEVAGGDFFSIYPNPNNGQFTIESAVEDVMSVEIRDVAGKLVFSGNYNAVEGSKIAVNVNSQAKGMYTVKVNGEVSGATVRRMIVQ